MIIVCAILTALIAFIIPSKTKRELALGKLTYHNELEIKESHSIIEEVRFKNSIECTRNYNNLVFQFSNSLKRYDIDSWTYNRFPILKGSVEIFRYGNHIKMIKTKKK